MCDVWSCVANVPVHLPHDSNMLVTVEEGVLFVFDRAATTIMRGFVRFETCIGEDHDQSLRVFVGGCYGCVLFGHELWKFWWGAGLGCPFSAAKVSIVGRSRGRWDGMTPEIMEIISNSGGRSTFTLSLLWPGFWRHNWTLLQGCWKGLTERGSAGEDAKVTRGK